MLMSHPWVLLQGVNDKSAPLAYLKWGDAQAVTGLKSDIQPDQAALVQTLKQACGTLCYVTLCYGSGDRGWCEHLAT